MVLEIKFTFKNNNAILNISKGSVFLKKIEEAFNNIILKEIIYSVIYGLFGLFIYFKSDITNKAVGLLIGVFLLVYGSFLIYTNISKIKIKFFRYNLVLGILNLVLAIFVLLNPLSLLNVLTLTLAIWLLLMGINKILYFIELKNIKEDSRRIILVSAILYIIFGILLIINPFRTQVVTKTVGVFILVSNILNINDLILLKKRSKNFLKLFK